MTPAKCKVNIYSRMRALTVTVVHYAKYSDVITSLHFGLDQTCKVILNLIKLVVFDVT